MTANANPADIGFGLTLEFHPYSAGTTKSTGDAFVGDITDFSFSGFSKKMEDATHSGSAANNPSHANNFLANTVWQEFIAGSIDPGELNVSVNFDGDTPIPVRYAKGEVKLTLKKTRAAALAGGVAATLTVDGEVSDYSPKLPIQTKCTADIKFKLSGMPVLTVSNTGAAATYVSA